MNRIAVAETAVLADLTHDERRKIPALTGIRGYAALWVVGFHCAGMGWHHFTGTWARTEQVPFIITGYLGVELFFVLSGFILTKIYGTAVSNMVGLRDFAVGRVFRILPIYWLSLIMLALIAPLMDGKWLGGYIHNLANLTRCFLLIQSWVGHSTAWNPPGWSLSAEWLAYFVFPLLSIVSVKLRRPSIIIALALAALLTLRLIYYQSGYTSLNNVEGAFGLARCLCEFTIGVALGRLHQIGWTGARLGDGLLVAGLILLLPPMVAERFDFLAIVAFSFMVLSAGSHSRYAHALFGNRVAHFLGEISFSIYVLHWPVLELVFRFVPGTTPLVIALAAVPFAVVPLAWATWRWVEVPGQAAGRVVITRLRARDAARRSPATSFAE